MKLLLAVLLFASCGPGKTEGKSKLDDQISSLRICQQKCSGTGIKDFNLSDGRPEYIWDYGRGTYGKDACVCWPTLTDHRVSVLEERIKALEEKKTKK